MKAAQGAMQAQSAQSLRASASQQHYALWSACFRRWAIVAVSNPFAEAAKSEYRAVKLSFKKKCAVRASRNLKLRARKKCSPFPP